MAKKGYGEDPFANDDTPQGVNEMIYGAVQVPESGREVVRPVGLLEIHPDPTQPRRAVPAIVRKKWNGDPTLIPALLDEWQAMARASAKFGDTKTMLEGVWDGEVKPHYMGQEISAVCTDWLDLVGLASSIWREGLTNPISITGTGYGGYVLIAGERRYLAFHLLQRYMGDKWGKIPARVRPKPDVWAQASENGARKPLNAIGMARQLALLIMDMYAGENTGFQTYAHIAGHGGHEREFYAQVANGVVWRIKKGMGQRILDVTGLKTRDSLTDYRQLLTLPNDVWVRADDESWTLGRIQKHMGWKYGDTDMSDKSDILSDEVRADMSEKSDISPVVAARPPALPDIVVSQFAPTESRHVPNFTPPKPVDWGEMTPEQATRATQQSRQVMPHNYTARLSSLVNHFAGWAGGDLKDTLTQFPLSKQQIEEVASPDWAQNVYDAVIAQLEALLLIPLREYLELIVSQRDELNRE